MVCNSQKMSSGATCCAVQNWLLEVDGLDVRWDNSVAS
jgi:hypothetical protein